MIFSWRDELGRLADHIGRLEQGSVDSELSEQFYESGQKDGRKRRRPDAARSLLVEAIDLATSKLGQQYVDERQALRLQVEQAQHRASALSGGPEVTALQPSSDAAAQTAASNGAAAVSGKALNADRLQASLQARQVAKQRQRREAAAAEARQRRDELQQLEESQVTAREQLDELEAPYRQRIETVHELGRFLWARYCTGYEHGQNRRGRPEDESKGPTTEIEFRYPAVLSRTGTDGVDGLHATSN